MRVLNAAQMREADRITIDEIGIASLVLMECAGRQVVATLDERVEDLAASRIAVLCGTGNNGGDGFVVARTLLQAGHDVAVFLVGRVADVTGDARTNLDILGRLGHTIVEIGNEQEWELHASDVSACDVAIDALFGTGLSRPLSGLFETIVHDINASTLPVVAIDLPSGLSGSTADVIGPAIEAELTVTFAAPKLPHVLPPAEALCGDVVTVEIGIPAEVVEALDGPRIDVITGEAVAGSLEPRDVDTHKGDYGRVLIVAGSVGRTGAAYLAAMAALRSGAGLVTVATPASALPILASMGAEFMTLPLPEIDGRLDAARAIELILEAPADVIAAGPGLGTGDEIRDLVFGLIERSGSPLVLDADALTVCARDPGRLRARDGLDVVITPHPGEMARLAGISTADVQKSRLEVARSFATGHEVHVVLKGHRTVVVAPDGRTAINRTGNPGMATGGTGDVLTGVIAAWLAQLLDAEAATRVGVYLHGKAGDLAAAAVSAPALVAGDVLRYLGAAWRHVTGEASDDEPG
jgi:ADP-dependent NAD(P)H-hydrate dehydratase / NAD(P)H-hydrate epimerase